MPTSEENQHRLDQANAALEQEFADLQRRTYGIPATQSHRIADTGPQHSYESDRARLAHQQVERASAWMAAQEKRPMRFDVSDLMDALPTAFSLRAGLKLRSQHPMAEWASELSFQRLAEQLQCRSLTDSDFGSAMATGFRQLVTSAYSAIDDCGPCFLDSVVPNFQPVSFPVVDTIDLAALPPSNGQMAVHIPLQTLSAGPGEPQGRVESYRARVLISCSRLQSSGGLLAIIAISCSH